MRKRPLILCLVLALPLLTLAGSRDAQWQKVDEAVKKGLPRTAIDNLEPIIAAALKDKAYPEAIKAIARKIALEGTIEGNHPEEKIVRMKTVLATAPIEMRPVLDTILANWYWHYFQQNRWRFLKRTAIAGTSGEDITTWDLARILAEVDRQFQKALAADKSLKAIPVAQYDELLEKGNVPDTYRPTLYDFLAHQALNFYSAGEQAGAKAEDAFEISADSPAFARAEEFLKWSIPAADAAGPTVRALHLYQALLKFHHDDKDKNAFLDADLLRLHFAYNKAFGENKNQRYKDALRLFIETWADHEISARARHSWASVLQQEDDLTLAHKIARQGAAAFPESHGGKLCFNLVQQIEAKSAAVSTERVWNEPWPSILVRCRNITKVYFRAVPIDFDERLRSPMYRPDFFDHAELKRLLEKKPALAWSVDLRATTDYRERGEKLVAPKDLKAGFYVLIASHDPDFGAADNQVSCAAFWVSTLALVNRQRYGEPVLEGFVLDASSGEPIVGAEVRAWAHVPKGPRVATGPVQTDDKGMFRIAGKNQSYLIHVKHKGQELASAQDFYPVESNPAPAISRRTIFFTDRSLYRPGQTIQYRGLCIQVDQDKDDYKVVPGQAVTVIFADHNGKEVARHAQRSNDFGSFAGSFTAPAVGATGSVSIRTEAEPFGAVSVNVEEYKRPKFLTKLEKPTKAARLNDVVHLEGKALAYTGAAVDGAPVQWRVVRQVRYPDWWGGFYWWRVPRSGVSQEIARGATVTKADGSFAIEFPARPDPSVPAKDEPTFHYLVSADVTDSAGETRSGQIDVNVGYTALKATLTAAPWQRADQPVELKIATATLDGEGQVAEGFVKVYRLKQPDRVHRKDLSGGPFPRRFGPAAADREKEPEPDPSNPASWALGEVAFESGFTTDKKGAAILKAKLGTGAYRAVLETQDRFGKKVTAKLPLDVVDPAAKALGIKVPSLFAAPTWQIEPGAEFTALWGTGYESGRAFVEVEHRGKLLQSYWTPAGQTQVLIKQAVDEAMRGGFSVRITFVRENRAYLETRQVDVPWSNKELKVRWEHFVSKLEPGHKETWTAIITGPDARKAVAEMVATLYDESLDAYLPHRWMKGFGVFRHDHSRVSSQFQNQALSLQHMLGFWPVKHKETHWTYRAFPSDLTANLREYEFGGRGGLRFAEAAFSARGDAKSADRAAADGARREGAGPPPASPTPDPASVTPRKNLSETAFFFPQLVSSEEGVVKMVFTMPEALTRWKFMGFAHDKALRSGFLEDSVVTARELMVQPYPPRFLREGDLLEFTVKVTNQSEGPLSGIVRLTLADARTDKSVDALLGNTALDQSFDIPAKESRSYAWRLKVPDDLGVLTYKAVATSGKLSDGEEGFLPVLSKRVLVTESLPLPIRGPGVKTFDFARLRASGSSDTLKHQQVVVQIVSNPAWYGVMALPYLMEFPHECTEQSFNRLYANALARHIATSDPKIRKVFEQWKGTPALDSPLEKNADLRSVLLEETPWLRQAKKESEARRNVAILFDDNRLDYELARLQRKMAELQLPDGAWSWFPSGPPNDYITLYITTGYGRLRHLGVNTDMGPALRSLERLDGWADRIYRDIRKHGKPEQNHLSPTIALYLYGRSFFLKDRPVAAGHKEAVDYFLGQARTHWLALAHRQSQGHLALALARFGDQKAAEAIMRSIKERAVSDEEMGMFWRDLERSWWWFRAPIETQALMIEAFDEVMKDGKAVEDCRVWLLKQKQTQDWKTTKATADAVYALLLRGADLLASDVLVDVTIAGMPLKAEKVEAGTGFFEKRYVGGEVNPKLGSITLKKTDEGVAWGSVNWQYLEDVSKVAAYEGTPLKLRKEIYTKVYTKKGPALQPMKGALKVGDELVVRLELRVDRDMEYVHLKDSRGSGTEPVNVLSQYRFQDGLTYYESTRDTASHFFIDYLPKGTYVFEYSTRVVHKGAYETGMAQIQCMYAPEFNSHSESFLLRVE